MADQTSHLLAGVVVTAFAAAVEATVRFSYALLVGGILEPGVCDQPLREALVACSLERFGVSLFTVANLGREAGWKTLG